MEERTMMKRSSAEGNLEKLMAARKEASVSPLPSSQSRGGGGGRRVTVRLSKEEYRKVMRDSKDEADAAKKIMEIYAALNDQTCGGVKNSEEAIKQPNIARQVRNIYIYMYEISNIYAEMK